MDFIFKESDRGLSFVGDFDGLYSYVDDPWGQSGRDRCMYTMSRKAQLEFLRRQQSAEHLIGLDVGCGLGYTTHLYSSVMPFSGCDISNIAIQKARAKFPDLDFHLWDVRTSPRADRQAKYSVVILNQLLWYVIDDFSKVLDNARKLLVPGGRIMLSNFIFSDSHQRFAREYFKGNIEIVQWLSSVCTSNDARIEGYLCMPVDDVYYDFHASITCQ